ncbi:VWA domain containing CoxE-like protein [Paenibacillus algorifonticola]|uniref:VWA domain containing CoxE-like protein n=1 Tax=Paenibacillus algorifonticola TaxID=684063 RepID=A0A1I2AFD3_9BACL|nr:VWA domain-containing protein [Paenibacillus algorifonticola]SFE41540.1 VWA domain containing CoxE-like protein [Paenibacillus algorifonticola]
MEENRKENTVSRWRLILGQEAESQLASCSEVGRLDLTEEELIMDAALAAIYDESGTAGSTKGGSGTGAGRGSSSGHGALHLSKWLGDVRSFFPEDVVSIIQNDAMERKGWKQLLFEPELLASVKPDIQLVGTLLSLKGKIPEKTKDTARLLVKAVVDELVKLLETDIRRAVTGALNKRQHSPLPSLSGLDWKRTIQRNLKHYDTERRVIIPEKFYYFDRAQRSREWTVIIDIDQSGSMADSIIWASVIGSIFASIPALNTRVVVFDTEVVDLTVQCANDPVDMLFGIQLGGGTDIHKSVKYCEQFIEEPKKTLFIIVSDLYEGGNQSGLIRRMREMRESGVRTMCLLALSDKGKPFYDEGLAKQLSRDGTPCFACTPALLPTLVEGALKGQDLAELSKRIGTL